MLARYGKRRDCGGAQAGRKNKCDPAHGGGGGARGFAEQRGGCGPRGEVSTRREKDGPESMVAGGVELRQTPTPHGPYAHVAAENSSGCLKRVHGQLE